MEFEDRVIAFIDILGWKKAVENASNNVEKIDALYKLLEPINGEAEEHTAAFKEMVMKEGTIFPIFKETQFSFFSDSIAWSMPLSMAAPLLGNISTFIRFYLTKEFVVRGGVVAGKLIHSDRIIFGEALIQAHKIESERAIFARVMVDDSLRRVMGRASSFVLEDHLGNLVVDPFPLPDVRGYTDINAIVRIYKLEEILKAISSDVVKKLPPKEKDKWRYQAKLCALSIKQHGEIAKDWVKKFEDVAQAI